ncbi:MAG: primosomal protein N' [Byssovorax sp.]
MPLLADIAVPVPLSQAFSYAVPASMQGELRPGARVVCELGARRVLGVVLSVAERPLPPGVKQLKPIRALVDAEPVLPAELLGFLVQLSQYYFAPIGEVLRLALPAMEREQVKALKVQAELGEAQKQVGARKVAYARPTAALEAPGSLRGQAAAILGLLRASGEQPVARIEDRFGNARAAVKKLCALGLAEIVQREPPRDPFFDRPEARDEAPVLNAAQARAAEAIEAALDAERESTVDRAFLLFGVTGSGKTEVYLRAIAACLSRGRGALVMVPEIALTPQLVSRFRARFGDALAVVHSALAEVERHAMWQRLRKGEVRVAIGARSALFAPVPDLGLVIVDEEHDSSFKQEEGIRYHARDMALLRGHRARAAVVLGSATPSLESMGLVKKGKLVELDLPGRAVPEASLPRVSVIDLKRIGAGPSGDKLLSIPLHRAIEETLKAKEQVILFLNRRGFAPSVVCDGCGSLATCRACSVSLTYHKAHGGRMRCHYCDYEGPLPEACAACGAPSLSLEGLGTERLEGTIAQAFPGARVARLDRDVAGGDRSQAILDRMRRGEVDILVGTQMVAKGHDLPAVTLVGVVNADAALSMPDFRAAERGFQLLVQVAGRAGRRDKPGRVLIQTRAPDHPAIVFSASHDVRGFLAQELRDRQEVDYPPFTRLALFRIDAGDEEVARDAAARIAALCRTSPDALARRVDVLGPAAAPIARLRGRYRFRVMLRGKERGPLRAVIEATSVMREALPRSVRVAVDVDPVSML